jgi:hypothetical protein
MRTTFPLSDLWAASIMPPAIGMQMKVLSIGPIFGTKLKRVTKST